MSSDLDALIQLGQDITTMKYYMTANTTVLLFDYLLTLPDEIKYFWSARKSWAFWLFIANRYFPMTYQLWQIGFAYTSRSELYDKVCEKMAWYALFTFVVCSLLAQVVLTLRIYALTMKNISISLGFASITAVQLGFGIYMTSITAKKGAQAIPSIPLDAYTLCVFYRHRDLEIAYTSISLLYDSLAFLLIISMAVASKTKSVGLGIPMILRTIVADATRYFLVIFSAHVAFEMTLNIGQGVLQLLPGPGLVVYLPVLISRIMLSLRKAAALQERSSTFGVTTTNGPNFQSIRFFHSWRGPGGRGDDIPLETYYLESRLETQ